MTYHLAQCNIARAHAPLTELIMAEFVAQLDATNALAESSPGFVWRLKDDSNSATGIHVFDDPLLIVNMSVWESRETLFNFTYRTQHTDVFRMRKEWFAPLDIPHLALWWLPADQLPIAQDVKTRLDHLHMHGASPFAFTFKTFCDAPDDRRIGE